MRKGGPPASIHVSLSNTAKKIVQKYMERPWESSFCKELFCNTFDYYQLRDNLQALYVSELNYFSDQKYPLVDSFYNKRKDEETKFKKKIEDNLKAQYKLLQEFIELSETNGRGDGRKLTDFFKLKKECENNTTRFRALMAEWSLDFAYEMQINRVAPAKNRLKEETLRLNRESDRNAIFKVIAPHVETLVSALKGEVIHNVDKLLLSYAFVKDAAPNDTSGFFSFLLNQLHQENFEVKRFERKRYRPVPDFPVRNMLPMLILTLSDEEQSRVSFKIFESKEGRILIDYQGCTFAGACSPKSPLTIDDDETMQEMSLDAEQYVYYAYIYPVLSKIDANSPSSHLHTLMLYGGFAYFDKNDQLMQINALGYRMDLEENYDNLVGVHRAFHGDDEDTDFEDDEEDYMNVDRHMFFAGPFHYPDNYRFNKDIFHYTTFEEFSHSGVEKYAWVTPGEMGTYNHGCFMFLTDEGEMFYYNVLKNKIGSRSNQLSSSGTKAARLRQVDNMYKEMVLPLTTREKDA